ncbi:BrnA antitoxin family protein [Dokdonella sp.]|uniref:BrnA antitoxin family protein n=1 Tax=Dokdonella sp. TaxID=2291710 RepID=UPI0025BA9FF6|nr:BrnA antitoxin family protein [Dokdonella sp.]MBX3692433.1 BrnA antitoxin family protein [Dokdonella sp.]
MNASKLVSARTLKSDLKRVDSHKTKASEYKELPELTDGMLKRGTVKRAGRPVSANPRRQVTIRLPESVLAAWKATGPGWQTRMAELLSKRAS